LRRLLLAGNGLRTSASARIALSASLQWCSLELSFS